MKEALFWNLLPDGKVQCVLCPHHCVIESGGKGFCRVRRNQGGKLYNDSYGALTAMHVDPIEKKPLYHFKPGSNVYSIGTYGCNLACDFCQNHEISQADSPRFSTYTPEEVVEDYKAHDCIGIAYTYSEPITWIEFVMDVASLNDGFNILVSNGYINPGPLKELIVHIDAANIDVKGDTEFYRGLCHSPYMDVMRNVRTMYEAGVHVEATNLIIPGYNDSEDGIRSLSRELAGISADVPLHFSRFFPHFRMLDASPTPLETLDRARAIAIDEGIKHVYIGNVQATDTNTYCPRCGATLVSRSGYFVSKATMEGGRCPECKERVYGKW